MPVISIPRAELNYPLKYHDYHKVVCPKFIGFTYKSPLATLMYEGELTEQEVTSILAADVNFVDNDPFQYILQNILLPARQFGQTIIDEFAAENVLLGITQAGKTGFVRKACREVTDALMTGSLYDALTEVRALPPEVKDPVFLSDVRLLALVNRVEDYLKIPRSTSL
jgi:hypothetical protein